VLITTDWCFACKIIKPVVEQLKYEYEGKVTFITLNATNDETLANAWQIASTYGISDFFNSNRTAFPRVAIFCPGKTSPDKNILGASKKETYIAILDTLTADTSTCSLGETQDIVTNDSEEESPVQIDLITGRPVEPNFLDRPKEMFNSGRPKEFSFWVYGEPMPPWVYFSSRAVILPECKAGNQILCYKPSGVTEKKQESTDGNSPAVFKPWDPNATRDEKGYKL
jgi:hypothetical protein